MLNKHLLNGWCALLKHFPELFTSCYLFLKGRCDHNILQFESLPNEHTPYPSWRWPTALPSPPWAPSSPEGPLFCQHSRSFSAWNLGASFAYTFLSPEPPLLSRCPTFTNTALKSPRTWCPSLSLAEPKSGPWFTYAPQRPAWSLAQDSLSAVSFVVV